MRWAVVFHNQTQEELALEVDAVLILAGYITKLGPLANWGLALEKNKIKVDTTMATSIPGVYACGDIVTYPGKLPSSSWGSARPPSPPTTPPPTPTPPSR